MTALIKYKSEKEVTGSQVLLGESGTVLKEKTIFYKQFAVIHVPKTRYPHPGTKHTS